MAQFPRALLLLSVFAMAAHPAFPQTENAPISAPISLDEFMNATDVQEARLSPNGSAAVITASAPDWQHNRFASDLWIWRQGKGPGIPLTRSGHARSPQWSPDGHYLAFLSDLPLPAGDSAEEKSGVERLWLIAAEGGEPFPLYKEELETHAFAWSADGSQIFFACPTPLTKNAEAARKAEWKDVVRWREQEHGDLLLSLPLAATLASLQTTPAVHPATVSDDALPLPALATTITRSNDSLKAIAVAQNGSQIAFVTDSVSQRQEGPEHNEIYLVAPATGSVARRLTNNQALESAPQWSPDSSRLFFHVAADAGALDGPYRDVQGRVYAVDPASGQVARMGTDFEGSFENFTVTPEGAVIATGLKGTQQQLYRLDEKHAEPMTGLPGTYAGVAAATHANSFLVKYSTVAQPAQILLVADAAHVDQAKAITSFNPIFAQRAQPEWKPYQWKADDGSVVEGMLIYPPGTLGKKHLRMLTLIHGGPADADGNRFGADWYDWATLAAANGWLVFRPNYRGSTGYGDRFMLEIAPHLVSRPGKDILEGVDALVKDGIADPDHLTIGGYSYGGYMTNWLITQTTRFKAAVTGAGAVEHAANWGNDDTSFDDQWYMGGVLPWQNPAIYQSEAALFQMDKVRTPTHLVGGDADVRVSYLEDVLLERSLQQLHVPHTFLSFPGEGHSLDKDPWHGYIKVRDELQWLEKYGGRP